MLLAFLRRVTAQALRQPSDNLAIDQPLTGLGLDSLSAVEVHGQIQVSLGSAPEVAQLLDGMSLEEICGDTLARLESPPTEQLAPIRATATPAEGLQPVSSGQEALWFLHQLAPESGVYHIAGAARLRGPLDTAALDRAFARLAERHPALRTRFIELDEATTVESGSVESGSVERELAQATGGTTLVQEVLPVGTPGIEYCVETAVDWQDEGLRRTLEAASRRPFDLANLPLMRALVLRPEQDSEARNEHILHLVVHHIVADFWSIAVLLDELGKLYQQESAGRFSQLAPRDLHYTDWVRWQRGHLAGPEGDALESYWLETLSGDLQPLDLATDHPRPPVQTFDGGNRRQRVDPDLFARLKAHSASSGVTLYTVLLAAFQALLHRLTGQGDILVGSPEAGRNRPELAELVGYFVNPLVLRGRLDGRQTWASHLEQTRCTALDAFRHRDYPFDALVQRLQPERSASRPPVFQVFFTLHQPPRHRVEGLEAFALGHEDAQLEIGGLSWQPLTTQHPTTQFELELTAAQHDDGLTLVLTYSRGLFEVSTIDRWLSHLQQLIAGAVDQPGDRIVDLPLLTPVERRQLLIEWNAGPRIGSTEESARVAWSRPVHRRIADQAQRNPDAVAVECAGHAMRYGELVERARRLAARLQQLGVGPEVPVGLCIDRSTEMITGVLGILMAGGAYVPLDPSYPSSRLIYSLEDALASPSDRPTPRLLVTRTQDRHQLRDLEKVVDRVVEIDPSEALTNGASPSLAHEATDDANRLAYVIYTSGSTGRPKGVQIEHGALANFLESMRHEPGLDAGDVLVAVTTLAFDIAALEILLPLVVGAKVVLLPREVVANATLLAQQLEACGATTMQATPATWRLLIESGWRGKPDLKMLCGGEALPSHLAAQLHPRGGELWNLYGPTETTIWSGARKITPNEDPIRFGGPILGTRLHVLDRHLTPRPQGIPGELWIAGDGLARGYRGKPALTAERFLPDPLAGECGPRGGRVYRVGDVARFVVDGELEFLGRVDHQIKLRGHRIELGEIEASLAAHPQLAEVVAGVVEVDAADPRLVAWYVPVADGEAEVGAPSPAELQHWLRRTLPEYMVPSRFEPCDALPLTPNGKVDRSLLTRQLAPRSSVSFGSLPESKLEREIAALWCEVLGIDGTNAASPGLEDSFFDLGGHSLLVTRLHRLMQERLQLEVSIVELFRHPTIGSLARHLAVRDDATATLLQRRTETEAQASLEARIGPPSQDVAIIGMAGRFPGARDVDELWRNVRSGVESISFFDEAEMAGQVPAELLADERYVRARGVLDGAEDFDSDFFGFTPREAEVMDPQHRLFLECAQDALDNAGYDPSRYGGKIGLFAGVGMSSYLLHVGEQRLAAVAGSYQAFISNDKDFVPTRVSYKLDLRGPSVNVQTACSSSLVAVHMACQSLAAGESDMALAGGITVRVPQTQGYLHEPGSILSPDGHCRAFDAQAGGTVLGNGTGIVVLKPLEAALAEGDRVLAVVKGSAINNDGGQKMGYTAPSVEGQAEVIRGAHAAAGVSPASIDYVEAHGTGTELGDPIEVAALTQAFNTEEGTSRCALGSVKTNIGHLDTAAGIAGLIKTVQALRHGELPPSLHFERPNPRLDLGDSPFRIQQTRETWSRDDQPRRAAVSSFGIGGTNAHVILEQAPSREEAPQEVSPPSQPPLQPSSADTAHPSQLLLISARTASALEASTRRLAERLRTPEAPSLGESEALADIAYTLQVGRRHFDHRRWLIADSRESAAEALEARDSAAVRTAIKTRAGRRIVMLFSGQGAQYVDMGRQLYDTEPVFRRQLDACADRLTVELGLDIREIIYSNPPETGRQTTDHRLRDTRIAQPSLFALEVAVARQWMAWGVQPAAMLGHSIGELVAATLAGVFSLEDALSLVAKRGRLMAEQPEGAMLGVAIAEHDLLPLLGEDLQIAAINGPKDCVVSGPSDAIAALESRLEAGAPEARCQPLHTSHAFHSAMMRPAIRPWVDALDRYVLSPPRIPFVSNLTGDWIRSDQATDPEYWGRHLVEPVRFADGLATVTEEPAVLLEVGPGHALSNLARSAARSRQQAVVALSSLPHPKARHDTLLHLDQTLGQLWGAGADIDWAQVHGQRRPYRRRVELPSYPYERQRYWLEPESPQVSAAVETSARSSSGAARADVGSWISTPMWKPSLRQLGSPASDPTSAGAPPSSLLLVSSDRALGQRVVEHLKRRVDDPKLIDPGHELANLLPLKDHLPGAASAGASPASIRILTRYAFRVEAGDPVEPAQALLWGMAQTLAQEHPELDVRCIDIGADLDAYRITDTALDDLISELMAPAAAASAAIALRNGRRTQRVFEPLHLPAASSGADETELPPRLRSRGPWLVTGGFGGVGPVLAETLANAVPGARLVLLGRHASDQAAERLRQQGAEVEVALADVADPGALRSALARAKQRFGPLRGVIHAAGIAGGGSLATRRPSETAHLLRPKVAGTRNLFQALADSPLDFAILCSSINSVVGGFGQGDYAAANAFVDAFAQRLESATKHDPGRSPLVVALGWDRWRDVGMARDTPLGATHPLLGIPILRTPQRVIHRALMSPETHWILAEHEVAGHPTVPGASYLEMARAAWRGSIDPTATSGASCDPVEIRNVFFLEPLVVDPGAQNEVLTVLELAGEQASFQILSRPLGADEAAWREHCRGTVGTAAAVPRRTVDTAQPGSEMAVSLTAAQAEERSSPDFLVTGHRWHSLISVQHENHSRLHATHEDRRGELLVELGLPEDVAEDLAELPLHPALLDIAVGCVQLIRDGDFLPLSYQRLILHTPLPPRLWSYLQSRSEGDTLICDATLVDHNGLICAEVEGFAMQKVSPRARADLEQPKRRIDAANPAPSRPQDIVLNGRIEPKDAAEILLRLLTNQQPPPHLVVSANDWDAVVEAYRDFDPTALDFGIDQLPNLATGGSRNALDTAFVAPKGGLEQVIAQAWQRFLGIESIGINDNFFELGGTSLLGVQVIGELQRRLEREIPTVSLFEAPTIAALAEYLEPSETPKAAEHTQLRANKKKAALESRSAGRGRRARSHRRKARG
ncbi:MAG: amino acid adenylation domain-containing protein [Acidobacteriota bacterium]